MTTRATSRFVIDSFDVEPFAESPAPGPQAAKLSRSRIAKTFSGDIEGTGVVEAVMAQSSVEGSAAYVGLERIRGTLHGRAGSFVLRHAASANRGAQAAIWTVVADSGDGQLSGLSGTGEIIVDADGGHTLVLDYDMAEASPEPGPEAPAGP